MFIPYRTDAPVYHRPIATIGAILACCALSIAAWQGVIDAEPLKLQYDQFRPHQWITSNFLHGGVLHLLGNCIFLWVFGLIVEGKVGSWRFLAIFLAIAVPQCAIEQLLFSNGASLGASAVVYGLIGIGLVWAPENEVEIAWVLWLRAGTFTAKVRTVALWYVLMESLWLGLRLLAHGFASSSELLHLMGFAIGAPIGVWMLRRRMVDCEGWDWFAVRRGDHRRGVIGGTRRAEQIRRDAAAVARAAEASPDVQREALRALRAAIAAGDAPGARIAASRLRQPLERVDLFGLADLLYSAREWHDAGLRMSEARRRFPGAPLRLSLRRAEIAIRHESRPAAALELLAAIPTARLTPAEARTRAVLTDEAERARAASPLEFADEAL